MPFGFHRRAPVGQAKSTPAPSGAPEAAPDPPPAGRRSGGPRTGVPFDALTDEWRLVGLMQLDGRLLDILNRREAVPIRDVSWATLDSLENLEPAPGLQKVDPYDLIVVLAGDRTLPPLTDAEKAAHRVHKVAYDVTLELPPYRVIGTVFLHPGSEPERLMDRGSDLFFPVTNAVALLGAVHIGDPETDVVLVNRSYLRGVEQVDRFVVAAARERRAGKPAG
jgi:hypothetical protein